MESVYDRRDVVGHCRGGNIPLARRTCRPADDIPAGATSLPDVVVLPRAVAERALSALRASMTSAGHLAQRVGHEHLGYCGWRQESERCLAQRALIDELTRVLEGG